MEPIIVKPTGDTAIETNIAARTPERRESWLGWALFGLIALGIGAVIGAGLAS